MRGFPDLASREPMKAKFYEGELWKDELENLLLPKLEKYAVVVVEDTPPIANISSTSRRLKEKRKYNQTR